MRDSHNFRTAHGTGGMKDDSPLGHVYASSLGDMSSIPLRVLNPKSCTPSPSFSAPDSQRLLDHSRHRHPGVHYSDNRLR